jgi:hypothetical protein
LRFNVAQSSCEPSAKFLDLNLQMAPLKKAKGARKAAKALRKNKVMVNFRD